MTGGVIGAGGTAGVGTTAPGIAGPGTIGVAIGAGTETGAGWDGLVGP